LIPNFELGIAYSIDARFGAFAAFRKSLKDFYADESDVLSTSKLMAGVKYSF
jgi:hypothetical protein